MSTYTPAGISACDIDVARRNLRKTPPNSPPRVRSARAKSAQLEAALYGFDDEAKKSSARKQRKNSCAVS